MDAYTKFLLLFLADMVAGMMRRIWLGLLLAAAVSDVIGMSVLPFEQGCMFAGALALKLCGLGIQWFLTEEEARGRLAD